MQSAPESVRIRYEVAFFLEFSRCVVASLKPEIETNARVWKCSVECIDFLDRFSALEHFFVEAVNRFVVSVLLRSLIGKFRRVHAFTVAELTTIQD